MFRAVQYGYTGYNIDFEPDDAGNAEDAKNFADFLTKFADALHKKGFKLSVDVGTKIYKFPFSNLPATWNDFWDYKLIAASSVDKV